MKTNAKGFTLIELLAVIVILAIIALIATPIVLNLIDKARMGAAESSAYSFVKSAETAAVVKMMENTGIKMTGRCTVANKTTLNCSTADTTLTLDVKGDLPTGASDYVEFDSKGSIVGASLTINSYTVTVDSTGKASATKSA